MTIIVPFPLRGAIAAEAAPDSTAAADGRLPGGSGRGISRIAEWSLFCLKEREHDLSAYTTMAWIVRGTFIFSQITKMAPNTKVCEATWFEQTVLRNLPFLGGRHCETLAVSFLLLVTGLPVTSRAKEADERLAGQAAPITHGLRVFTCGHSFHSWIPGILSDMGPGLVAVGDREGSDQDTRRSFVTRPMGTHSTTKMLPSLSKAAWCGWTNRPGCHRSGLPRSPSWRTCRVHASS